MTRPSTPRSSRSKRRRADLSPVTLYPAWCKKCGICVAFCPKSVLDRGEDGHPVVARPEACIRCHMCELRCPDFAISVADEESSRRRPGRSKTASPE